MESPPSRGRGFFVPSPLMEEGREGVFGFITWERKQ